MDHTMGALGRGGEGISRVLFLAQTRQEWVGERSGDILSNARNNLTPAAAACQ
jgi:hypothetical protein